LDDQKTWELAQKLVKEKNVNQLCKLFFDVDLYPTQEKIVQNIVFQEDKNIILNCYTRYGKTFAVGIGLALLLIIKGETLKDFSIGILGPTESDAQRVRKEFLKAGVNSNLFVSMLDTSKGSDAEDLLKSRNSNKLTFNDGNIEVHNLSASSGSSGDGSGVMGDGVDILVMDESNRISHSFWKNAGNRLLEHEDAVLIELGNPRHKNNQFFNHWTNESFTKYHVGEKKGVKEGRHTQQWFDDKASEYPKGKQSIEYQVLYKSEFPDQVENSLIKYSKIQQALKQSPPKLEDPRIVYSIDVADEGNDLTVLTRKIEEDNVHIVTDQWMLEDSGDTGETAKWADRKIMEEPKKVDTFVVDYVGIGAGVWSKLKELGYPVEKFKAGGKPLTETGRFLNKKARNYFKIRDALEENDLYIQQGFNHTSN